MMACFYVLPNFMHDNIKWLPGGKVINLGLDLKGGSHLLFSVDFDGYIENSMKSVLNNIKRYLHNKEIYYKDLRICKNKVYLNFYPDQDYYKIKKIIKSIDSNLSHKQAGSTIILYYDSDNMSYMKSQIINQLIEIIRVRIDNMGTKDTNIQRQGDNILLQVPGQTNPYELKKILGQTAKLTFHLVDEIGNMRYIKSGFVPIGARIVKLQNTQASIVIKKSIVISGEHLRSAQVKFYDGKPAVHFILNYLGGKFLSEVTKFNQGTRIAIVLDDVVLSTPMINQQIVSGDGLISGDFTIDQATQLALMLNSGALPATLKIIEERTIGPNLGADSISAGKIAAVVSFIFVFLFMLFVYGILGLFASFALLISLIYILALLTLLQVTLTLPGIAGIILTMGMAVDANVLIYERIREEISKGYSILYAINTGFKSAYITIIDSNLTTLIAAFSLYILGIGVVRGFSVTLIVGIIVSMYTVFVVTKLVVDIWIKYIQPKNLEF